MASETDLHISKRLQALLPALTDEEREQLEANLVADKEKLAPICIWHDGEKDVIVDGMHSWPIVKKHKLSYRTRVMKFADYDEAEVWIIRHQLGTRGITPEAAKKLRGTLYNKLKQPHGGQMPEGGISQNDKSLFEENAGITAQIIAEQTGVSPSTVVRDGAFVDALAGLDKSLRDAIAMRHLKLTAPELKRLASLPDQQNKLGTLLRKGLAKTLAEAFIQCGITKAPPKAKANQKVDYGKCPNCAGTRWREDEDGVACAKCNHPHGEPAGGVDGDRIATQRSKTVKTVEALMRAFDDLQLLLGRPEHQKAIDGCKALLKIARAWK